jgi:hypothetical protein
MRVLSDFLSSCLLGCLLLSACVSDNHAVSFKSGGTTQTFADGAQAGKNFPLPLYPNAQTAGEVAAKGDGDEGSYFLMLSSRDSVDKINNFYNNKLKADGWNVKQNAFNSQLLQLNAQKPGYEASVQISGGDKQTSITLSFNKAIEGVPKMTGQGQGQGSMPDKLNPPTD